MKSLFSLLVFTFTIITAQASTNPVEKYDVLEFNKVTTELVINTKGVKKLEDINVVDFHKDTYLKLMLKVKRANKIC